MQVFSALFFSRLDHALAGFRLAILIAELHDILTSSPSATAPSPSGSGC